MSTHDDAYLKMTGDDLRAARVLSLAVKFFGTHGTIPSSTIARDLYPGLDEPSFNRQYLRDRELLATFGLVVRAADENGGDTLWKVDERASYVQGDELSPQDARMLYVLCHDLAFDRSFAYRDELRMALAKISQMYRGTIPQATDATTTSERKLLQTLVAAMGDRHAVQVTYTDAAGNTSERTLALLGSFGLHGRTYFVASRAQKDGQLEPNSVRTYRLDRFKKARELPQCRYLVPEDFCVNDYERLPFQIGDTVGVAQLALPQEPLHEVTRALESSGTVGEGAAPNEPRVWTVSYSNLQMMASWAVGTQLTPLDPPELVQAWHDTIAKAAAQDPYDEILAEAPLEREAQRRAAGRGRTGSITVARQLVALATSLTREGRVITARDIANTLGVSYDYARHLIALVSMTGGESFDYLPVILSDNDDEVSLMEGAAMSARRVRLTRSETFALQAALTELGVDAADPLNQTLARSFAAPAFSLEDVARSLEAPSSTENASQLRVCSVAISAGNELEFDYLPVSGGASTHRTVQPQRIRRSNDSWYLDAFDLVRDAERVFRIDRMSNVTERAASPSCNATPAPTADPVVLVRFNEPLYLELFHWDRLEVLERTAEQVLVRMPMYGGTWLAWHLIACAGTVQVGNKALAEQMQELAL